MLPQEFLAQMARDYELSKEQEEVFVLRYGKELSYYDIAKKLKTSEGACLKRMGQVYTKFKVSGSSRGKENRLRIFLTNQLQQGVQQRHSESTATATSHEEQQGTTTVFSSTNIKQVTNSETALPPIKENLPKRECITFIGRRQELTRLLKLLSFEHSAHLISIDGVGGVGKTTLVLEAAHMCLQASMTPPGSVAPTFEGTPIPTFEAIIFTSAKQQYLKALHLLPRLKCERTLRDIYQRIARTLESHEITYMEPDAQLELIHDSLKRQRTLLIVDNLETIEDKQEVLGFVYDLPPTVKVILTTREQALFVPIRLESLPEEDALSLIYNQAEEKGLKLTSFEAQVVYQSTHGIPVAIVYTIGQLAAGYSLADVRQKLNSATGDIARFCFGSSLERLHKQPSHRILMTLSLFLIPVERETIGAIAMEDCINTGDGLVQLQQLSLVRLQNGRYSLHPLTREYASAELTNNREFEQEVRERWVNWYLKFLQEYGNLDEKTWYPEYSHLDLQWENLQNVINWCMVKERYNDVLSLWRLIKGYAHVRGYWDDRLVWTDWLLKAAEVRADWSALAEVLYDRGWTLTLTRQPECLEKASALLQRAWELRNHQNISFQLELATRIVVLSIYQNKFDDAHQWIKVKQDMLQESGVEELERQRQQVQTLYYQAGIFFRAKDYIEAKKLYQQALKQAKEIRWQRAEIAIQNWLADVAIEQGNLEVAQQMLEQGLPVAQQNKDKRSIAFHHRSFALLSLRQGKLEKACSCAQEAALCFESLKMIPEASEMRSLFTEAQRDCRL
jgi:tetratricopeptide (TPR) repeat protein